MFARLHFPAAARQVAQHHEIVRQTTWVAVKRVNITGRIITARMSLGHKVAASLLESLGSIDKREHPNI